MPIRTPATDPDFYILARDTNNYIFHRIAAHTCLARLTDYHLEILTPISRPSLNSSGTSRIRLVRTFTGSTVFDTLDFINRADARAAVEKAINELAQIEERKAAR